MNTGEWSCLISFAWAPLTCSEQGGSEKFKIKIRVSSGIRNQVMPMYPVFYKMVFEQGIQYRLPMHEMQ